MEQIYNVFLYYTNDVCSTVGYVAHDYCGSDEQSLDFLKDNLREDFQRVSKLDLIRQFTLSEYNAKCRLGEGQASRNQPYYAVAQNQGAVKALSGVNPRTKKSRP
nr:hypothetical protein [Collimonas fungivorans]